VSRIRDALNFRNRTESNDDSVNSDTVDPRAVDRRLDPRRVGAWAAAMSLAVASALVACSGTGEEDADTSSAAVSTAGRWIPPASVKTVGAKVRFTYEPGGAWAGGSKCTGKLRNGSRKLGQFVANQHRVVTSVGGYSCRRNTADTGSMSVHGTGRALDIMLPRAAGGQADNSNGDKIANWLILNAAKIGIHRIIWDRSIWRANGTNDGAYGGASPHTDHLHVELTTQGAAGTTPWFKTMSAGDSGTDEPTDEPGTDEPTDDAGTEPPEPTEPDPEPIPEPDPDPIPEPDPEPIPEPPPPPPVKDAGRDTGAATPPPQEETPTDNTLPGEEDVTPGEGNDDDDGPATEGEIKPTTKRASSTSDGEKVANAGCSLSGAGRHDGSRGASGAGLAGLALAFGLAARRRRGRDLP